MGVNVGGAPPAEPREEHLVEIEGDESAVRETRVVHNDPRALLIRRGLAGQDSVRSGRLLVRVGSWTALPGTGLEVLWGEEMEPEAAAVFGERMLEFAVDLEERSAYVWEGSTEALTVHLTGKSKKVDGSQWGSLTVRGTLAPAGGE